MPDWKALIAKAEAAAHEARDAAMYANYAKEAADMCRDLVSMLEAARDEEESKS